MKDEKKAEQSEHFFFWALPDTAVHHTDTDACVCVCAPNFNYSTDLGDESVYASWASRLDPGASVQQLKHPLFQRDMKEEKKEKENSCQGSFLSFYLSHTETRCYNNPTVGPAQNNSRKCQTSVSEMRPGEVSSLSPPSKIHTHSQKGWGQTVFNNKLLPHTQKEHIATYTCWKSAHCVSLCVLSCIVTNLPPSRQTLRIACDSFRLCRDQQPPHKRVQSILLMNVYML